VRYWPQQAAPSPNPPEGATALLKKSIEKGATIVGIGPFTNLHLLASEFPGLLKETTLFLMGGYDVYPVRPGFPDWKKRVRFQGAGRYQVGEVCS